MESAFERYQALEQLASGRHIVNLCLFAWLAAAAFHVTETPLAAFFFLGSTIAAAIGTMQVAEGLDFAESRKTFIVAGSAIALLGLLVMGWISGLASKDLRSSGYSVGMIQSRVEGDIPLNLTDAS